MTGNDPDSELIAQIEKRVKEGTEFEGLQRIPARKPRNPRAVFSIRLSPEEFRKIANAATKRSSNVSDYVREAALEAASTDEQVDDYDLAAFKADVASLNRKIDQAIKRHKADPRIA